MRSLRTALTLAAALLLVASCASSSPIPVPAPPTDGCSRGVSQEAYQTGMYECPDGTLVFTFASTGDRDAWIHTATQFGSVVEGKGATWVKVREAG